MENTHHLTDCTDEYREEYYKTNGFKDVDTTTEEFRAWFHKNTTTHNSEGALVLTAGYEMMPFTVPQHSTTPQPLLIPQLV